MFNFNCFTGQITYTYCTIKLLFLNYFKTHLCCIICDLSVILIKQNRMRQCNQCSLHIFVQRPNYLGEAQEFSGLVQSMRVPMQSFPLYITFTISKPINRETCNSNKPSLYLLTFLQETKRFRCFRYFEIEAAFEIFCPFFYSRF